MSGLSLFAIEEALLELARAREELTDPTREYSLDDAAALIEVDKAIAEYAQCREPAKVDSIHGLLKQWDITAAVARQEAREYQERAQRLEANAARLKTLVCEVMAMAGKKRLEGTAGRAITRQANGGLAPLTVQEDLLPRNWRDVVVRMPASFWDWIAALPEEERPGESCIKVLADEPSNDRIRIGLKLEAIPGASLGERGEHVRLK